MPVPGVTVIGTVGLEDFELLCVTSASTIATTAPAATAITHLGTPLLPPLAEAPFTFV